MDKIINILINLINTKLNTGRTLKYWISEAISVSIRLLL